MGRCSQAISFSILLVTCCGRVKSEFPNHFLLLALMIAIVYAALGLLRVAIHGKEHSPLIEDVHDYSMFLIPLVALPCLATELLLKYSVLQEELAYCNVAIGITIAGLMMGTCLSPRAMDFLVVSNCCIIGAIGGFFNSIQAICTSIIYGVAHFGATHFQTRINDTIPVEDFYDLLLSGFIYFACLSVDTEE